jgi:hypothetical protein
MSEPVIWICRCGKFESTDGTEAFRHRNKYGNDDHSVRPVRESEIVRPERTLTGIELMELEEMSMPIPLVRRGIQE